MGYQPIDPPEYLQAAFDEGHRLESVVIDELNQSGWKIWPYQEEVNALGDYQHEVELEVIPGIAKVVGHLDGLCALVDVEKAILEIKTMNHKSFGDWKANGWESNSPLIDKYKWQASCYMLATGLPHVMVCWDKLTQEWREEVVSEPFYTISDIALKLAKAEEYIANGEIPDGCTDFPCPFFPLHGNNDPIPEPADTELDALLSAWMVADQAKKAYEGEAKALRELIVEMAGSEIAGKIRGSQGVTVSTVYQEASEYMTRKKAGWITKVSGPRKKGGGNVAE